ncbi:hypothetical protein P7D66_08545 [Enterococcus avium]|uniref:hypothetical protein n=1 Tax=Enterococcus avium TaxID=33945 RepID=UPI002890EE6F|nr:hypothetical protein [Enterococcus avium]MDT2422424.1 hypothetical protein [Enterococcus avium]
MNNISTAFKYNASDAEIMKKLLVIHPDEQVGYFERKSNQLSDYAYWFLLSTMWVKEAAVAPISQWMRLFSAKRPNRRISLMKPNEMALFKKLPNKLTVYRDHADETDWISYTLNPQTAIKFANMKNVNEVAEYKLKKHDCLALFLRRDEMEVLCMDKELAKRTRTITAKKEK